MTRLSSKKNLSNKIYVMMKSKNFYLLALVVFFFSSNLTAQTARIEKAKKHMKELNYQGAIVILQQVLAKNDNAEAKINIAECYRKVSDSQNAEFYYSQVVRLPEAQPIHSLYYGEMLQRNGKCDIAKEWYQKFAEAVPEDVRGQYMSKACDYEEELKKKSLDLYDVARANFNSNLDDFGATFYQDGIIFASERSKEVMIKRQHSWTGEPFLDLYKVPTKGNGSEVTYGRVEKFSSDINSKYHDAVVSFNKDQSEMFFTRNNFMNGKAAADDEGVMKLKIYSVKKKGANGWGNEENLPFNSDEYSSAHPSLSADGNKLFFASDMPGGFGGMDLYVSELEGGKWGPPVNLGPGINTEGHEVFPFIHQSGRLYFATDGHLGLGGMDIIYVDDKGNGQWSLPENPGAPINSKDDDFCLTLDEKGLYGFFSSDREGGSGRDDIYSFTKKAAPLKVYVYDANTMEAIEGAVVEAEKIKKTLKTGKDGKVSVEMKFNTCADFKASFEGYEPNTKEGCVKDAALADNQVVEIPLTKVMKHSVEGVVYDLSTGLPLGDAMVTLVCEDPAKNKTFTTDPTGRYTFPLENDLCYSLKGEKEKYFAVTTPDTVCTKGLKENKVYLVNLNLQPTTTPTTTTSETSAPPVASVKPQFPDMPKDKKKADPNVVYRDPKKGILVQKGKPYSGSLDGVVYKNGMIVNDPNSSVVIPTNTDYGDSTQGYVLHVYYDFDQSFIRDESVADLDKLFKMMKNNNAYIIEIASHTDARGSNNYNNKLSQRRAEAVVAWLIEKGIDRDRLVARGYGEKMSTNNCKNNIRCSEEEHQMNRRTEFRVLGCKGCEKETQRSRPNLNAKVDKCQGCPF